MYELTDRGRALLARGHGAARGRAVELPLAPVGPRDDPRERYGTGPPRAAALVAVARVDDRRGRVAIAAGIVAGSIALVGFGLDSAIEGVASVIIIWRFTGARVFSHAAEQRAQKLVAVQFFLLAPVRRLRVGRR